MLKDVEALQILSHLTIDFNRDVARARPIYEAARTDELNDPTFDSLVAEGWLQIAWGRITTSFGIARWVRKEREKSAFATLIGRQYEKTFHFSEDPDRTVDLVAVVDAATLENEWPSELGCQTPGWVAARLWEAGLASGEDHLAALRVWTDRWQILGWPDVVPSQVWALDAANAFRCAAIDVLASVAGLPQWEDARRNIIAAISLTSPQPHGVHESFVPSIPGTTVGRALWLSDQRIDCFLIENLFHGGRAGGLLRILLNDIEAADLSPAPNAFAAQLLPVIVERPALLQSLLMSIARFPMLLADMLFCPQTSALACLLVAQWQSSGGAWDKEVRHRDFDMAKGNAFADATSVMAHFLASGSVPPSEAAALLGWLHAEIDGQAARGKNAQALLVTLRAELAGQPPDILEAIVTALTPSAFFPAPQTPSFAAAIDVIDFGNLAKRVKPEPFIGAYFNGVASGDYSLSLHQITRSGASALYTLATRTSPETLHRFLFPFSVAERLTSSTEENPFTLADSIARSLRAHIRILCRIVAGLNVRPPEDLLNALVVTVQTGALEHKEKGRVSAFAPRREKTLWSPSLDRPIAVDLGEALSALQGDDRQRLLDALLETDEPLVLARILAFVPPTTRTSIEARIAKLTPDNAGAIYSLDEAQARIDQLLAADLPDSAARFMAEERSLATFGKIPERELKRLHAELRLMLLRDDWEGLSTIEVPEELAAPGTSSARDTIDFYRAIAQMKKPGGDLEKAAETFERLARRRSDVTAYRVNLLASRIGLLLKDNGFAVLSRDDHAQGRKLLVDAEALSKASSIPDEAEIVAFNRALLHLALGEPEAALPVLASITGENIRGSVAAYSAVALARLGRSSDAASTLAAAEGTLGKTEVLRAAREYLSHGTAFPDFATLALETDPVPRIKMAWSDFQQLDHEQQAQILSPDSSPFAVLLTSYIRAAAESMIGLVSLIGQRGDLAEDDLTALIECPLAARLAFLGWTTADQTRGGVTAKGNPGERDLRINKGTTTLAVLEAVVCKRPVTHEWARGELTSHFQKLFAYATCPLFFHLTYSYLDNPGSIVEYLRTAAQNDVPDGFKYLGCVDIPFADARPTGIVARYRGQFGDVRVVFLILDLKQAAQNGAAKRANATNPRNR